MSNSIEEALKEFDVVVGIPNSINEGINDIFSPEVDLFDLICLNFVEI